MRSLGSLGHLSGGVTTHQTSQHGVAIPFDSQRSSQEREFERLYRESYESVYGYVRMRMIDDSNVEDVVSEAYLRAARSFARFDPARAKFSTWVIAIAHNCMISYFRKKKHDISFDDSLLTTLSITDEQENVENYELIKQLLSCLEDDEHELIVLKFRDELRNTEIADRLGMNPSTVATKISRAIGKMRMMLS